MARVTDSEVREIKPSDSITDYTPYIVAASLVVDRLAVSSCGSSLSDPELAEIEKWLAAHFASAADPQIARERLEQAEATYQIGNRQMTGIMSDFYGQTANTLSGGCLLEMDKRKLSMKALAGREIPVD